MNTCAWRVKDDDIRTAVLSNKGICKNILHVTCVEVAVSDIIVLCIKLCILNCLWNIFNTNHFRSLARYELSNCTCSCVKVIYNLITSEGCEFASYTVKLICLLSVCLIERLRTNLETKSFHFLVDCILAFVKNTFLIRNRVICLTIDYIIKRSNLRELSCNSVE